MNSVRSGPEPGIRSEILTWRAPDADRMESTRIQLSGKKIKAYGRIVAAATDKHPAFSAYYDLQTDETGAAKRIGLQVTAAARERQLSIARDEENMWMVSSNQGESRSAFDGALDVDMVLSPFFNALPIRRLDLHQRSETVTVPVIYVSLPEMELNARTVSYRSTDTGIAVQSPVSDTTVTVDDAGFIVSYPGLAERI
ncbi:MAG TPA: putative glycolipid-binding domain-containing protein [Mycobacterium sp.]|nr:putative glycolipid-binding domain-containing protein [Mycobacterium sp.]